MLPAYAGMILSTPKHLDTGVSAPRVCGDDPGISWHTTLKSECSPRMRG